MTSILLHPIFNRVLSGFSQDVLGVFSGYSPLKQYAILNCMPIGGTLKKGTIDDFQKVCFFQGKRGGATVLYCENVLLFLGLFCFSALFAHVFSHFVRTASGTGWSGK